MLHAVQWRGPVRSSRVYMKDKDADTAQRCAMLDSAHCRGLPAARVIKHIRNRICTL